MAQYELHNDEGRPLAVPGLGGVPYFLDLPTNERFRHGAGDWYASPNLTARELAMLRLMEALTDKPEWQVKVFNDDIVDRWRAEALSIPLISEPAWEWCLAELRDKALLFRKTNSVLVLDASCGVCKSDTLASCELQAELKENVQDLFRAQARNRDWHPGSNEMVLDLVHPSLYPLVFGRTQVLDAGEGVSLDEPLEFCGKGATIAPPDTSSNTLLEEYPTAYSTFGLIDPIFEQRMDHHSTAFQWLPCEVDIGNSSDHKVRITSYINNLHPQRFKSLYATIEKVITLAIEPWNQILVKNKGNRPRRINTWGIQWLPPPPTWAILDHFVKASEDLSSDAFKALSARVEAYMALPETRPDRPNGEVWDAWSSDFEPDRSVGGREMWIAVLRKWHRIKHWIHPDVNTSYDYLQWRSGDTENAIIARGSKLLLPGIPPYKGPLVKRELLRDAIFDEHGEEILPEPRYDEQGRELIEGLPLQPGDYEESNASRWNLEQSEFQPVGAEIQPIDLRRDFGSKGLQIIIKIASFQLTPERLYYPGGSWHVEGMLNEHICATAIYYFDVENITSEAKLQFRQETNIGHRDMGYEHDCWESIGHVFAVPNFEEMLREHDMGPSVQDVGSVSTPDNRLIAFPNTLQHRLEPFELKDKSRPGHRSFLVLWLVDPHYRICSTRNVPPQQHDWWKPAALDSVNFTGRDVPQEVVDLIAQNLDNWPMGLDEAKRLRLELMAERSENERRRRSEHMHVYNFCEH